MENQQYNHFDDLLKQSLEGARLPVPSGVWESVGASISTKAIVATKVAGVKLIIIKSIAGLVITGGMVWGTYQLIQTSKSSQKTDNNSTRNEIVTSSIIEEKGSPKQTSPEIIKKDNSNKVSSSQNVKTLDTGSMSKVDVSLPLKDTPAEPIETKSSSTHNQTSSEEKKMEKPVKNEQPVKETGNNNPPEPSENQAKEQINLSIPNVFTPFEKDGYNDCFKILIENEAKYSIQIFDLQGRKVFESHNKLDCWDGRNIQTGQMCPRGFYTYKLIYELKTGFKKTERGELNLL